MKLIEMAGSQDQKIRELERTWKTTNSEEDKKLYAKALAKAGKLMSTPEILNHLHKIGLPGHYSFDEYEYEGDVLDHMDRCGQTNLSRDQHIYEKTAKENLCELTHEFESGRGGMAIQMFIYKNPVDDFYWYYTISWGEGEYESDFGSMDGIEKPWTEETMMDLQY